MFMISPHQPALDDAEKLWTMVSNDNKKDEKGNRHAEVCRRFPQEIYGSNPTSREEPKNKG
jgi:hypothetical protein